ncbi:MAG: class I SAM-dependent methyltransferase [Flavobacteriales bacterium TMED235]|nr:MAG: class I SAM-dependent methyltransferase [Flavobacteriales bacterium TMED235]
MNRNYEKIQKKHYDKEAKLNKASPKMTMGDDHVRSSETDFILNLINKTNKKNIKILDIGCGNGYTLKKISKLIKKAELTGFEPNDLLRNIAKKVLGKKARILGNSIRDLNEFSEKFDIIICQRIIINIQNYKDQKKALQNILTLSKKGTKLIFIEAFKSGLNNLNYVRKKCKLLPLKPRIHNLYLPDNFFKNKFLKKIIHDKEETLSSYYLIARVLHPIYLKAYKEKFEFNSDFVKFFKMVFPYCEGNFSQLKFLIYRFEK